MGKLVDLTGVRFGRLVALSKEPPRPSGETFWCCSCDCGGTTVVRSKDIRRGFTQSCGCLFRERLARRNTSHGSSRTPEHWTWANIIQRCTNPKASHYEFYGGRGITICERWRNDFASFLADVGPRPSPAHSIERVDNEKGYEPGNCVWATRLEQMKNTRRSKPVLYRGERLLVADAIQQAGSAVPQQLVLKRLRRGWPPERAIETPPAS
jgi:hypothetical protein